MQALIDQHSTKLTMMQSSRSVVEESAPVQHRIRYLPTLIYPAQYELKSDLAKRYLQCGVFNSALSYFKVGRATRGIVCVTDCKCRSWVCGTTSWRAIS